MLAPANWRRVASWTCGWLYVVGNITITPVSYTHLTLPTTNSV